MTLVQPTTTTSTTAPGTGDAIRARACIVRQVDRIETPLVRDAEALTADGYLVDLVVMRIASDDHRTELPPGVRVIELPVRRRRGAILAYVVDYVAFVVAAAVVVAARHVRRPYAVVQVISLPDFLVVAGLIPRMLGAALVLKIQEPTPQLSRSLEQPRWVQRLLGRLQIWSARRADAVLTVTDDLADDLIDRGVDASRISVVLNVPPSAMATVRSGARPDPDHFTVISHGSVFERYGHDTIVRAAALASEEVAGLRLVITGTGPHLPNVLELIDELGLSSYINPLHPV